MIHVKLILRSMLSLPVVREAQEHYLLVIGGLLYLGIIFLVLKTFQFNKDKFND